jgi:hypothetical protein
MSIVSACGGSAKWARWMSRGMQALDKIRFSENQYESL